jgi:Homeodomain-like domain
MGRRGPQRQSPELRALKGSPHARRAALEAARAGVFRPDMPALLADPSPRATRAGLARKLAASGMSTREIGKALGISHQTVMRDLRGPQTKVSPELPWKSLPQCKHPATCDCSPLGWLPRHATPLDILIRGSRKAGNA